MNIRYDTSELFDFWWAGHAEEFSLYLNAFMVKAVAKVLVFAKMRSFFSFEREKNEVVCHAVFVT